ncbi:unnamed protein product [Amoebophrya sp. A25]|nr:unnamed protein product [Amoebophrya sp. A25]|eukprot:GSA25T00013639001.1
MADVTVASSKAGINDWGALTSHLLATHSPYAEHETYRDNFPFLREECRVLVIGAGGLGCELLKDLAYSGFFSIDVIDLDTIDVSNLNRQFLFRQEHVGRAKAEVAAETINARMRQKVVTPHFGKIQDKSAAWYQGFNMVIAGLDNIDARRWINSLLHTLVQRDENGEVDPGSCIPLLDGGTEGLKGQARVIIPGQTSCFECGLDMLPPQVNFPICTIAETPRLPEHCVEYALVLLWDKFFGENAQEKEQRSSGAGSGADKRRNIEGGEAGMSTPQDDEDQDTEDLEVAEERLEEAALDAEIEDLRQAILAGDESVVVNKNTASSSSSSQKPVVGQSFYGSGNGKKPVSSSRSSGAARLHDDRGDNSQSPENAPFPPSRRTSGSYQQPSRPATGYSAGVVTATSEDVAGGKAINVKSSAASRSAIEVESSQGTTNRSAVESKVPKDSASTSGSPAKHNAVALNKDSPVHMQWLFKQALRRARHFGIQGVTYQLTMGVVKRIIPAVASTNAVIAAQLAQLALKVMLYCGPVNHNYFMFMGHDGCYSHTFTLEKKPDCLVCGDRRDTVDVVLPREKTLQDLLDHLATAPKLQLKKPSITSAAGVVFLQNPPSLRKAHEYKLPQGLGQLVDFGVFQQGEPLLVTDPLCLPSSSTLRIRIRFSSPTSVDTANDQ